MADNTALQNDSLATLPDGFEPRILLTAAGVGWVAGVTAYATTVSANANVLQEVTPTTGLPVQPQTSSTWAVTDNSGSLTVDAPVGTPVFVRLSDGSSAITTLPVSLASVPSHAVTNAGTFAVQVDGDALTALQLIDDVVYVDDADWTDSTSKHLLVGGLYQSSPQTITDGDVGPFQVTANGYLIVSVNGTVTVGSHAVTNAGTFAVQAAQSGTWTVDLGATDNAVLDAIAASLAGTLTVGSHAVTNAGTFAVQVDGTALTRLTDIETNTDSGAVVGNGAAATAQRVTLANDSTGIVALTTSTAAIGRAGHDTTGLGHGVKTVTSAGTDEALAASTACKWVVIQAQTDNTSLIAVGATGVDATVATGTGIILEPGDSITILTDNLADVFIDSLVNGEGVRYVYGT